MTHHFQAFNIIRFLTTYSSYSKRSKPVMWDGIHIFFLEVEHGRENNYMMNVSVREGGRGGGIDTLGYLRIL